MSSKTFIFTLFILALLLAGGVLAYSYISPPATIQIGDEGPASSSSSSAVSPPAPVSALTSTSTDSRTAGDPIPSAPLANPPAIVEAKYFTGWSAGLPKRMDAFLAAAGRTKVNAAVIDIKDYSGYVSYAMEISDVKAAGADKQIRISDPNVLLAKLHAQGIYVIGRVTVFQDPIFAKAHPELALHDKRTGAVWKDSRGLAWLDPAGKPTWDYVIGIAKDAYARGFDEINFDYVRFPSDGPLAEAQYPFWNHATTPRHIVLRQFFAYLRQSLPDKKISADLFGLTVVDKDDLGIGQEFEDALPYFDYVAPMIYPSHFANGFIGYANPAAHPYEVMEYALQHAVQRRNALAAATSTAGQPLAKLRPWIQVFDLGAKYTPTLVSSELKATTDVLQGSTAGDAYGGFLLWDPSNAYTSYDALF